jgi:hypothetical protein
VRSVGSGEGSQAWVRVVDAEKAGADALRIHGAVRRMTAAELQAGVAVGVAGTRVVLEVLAGEKVLASGAFEKPSTGREFGLLRWTPEGAAIDADLGRFFAMQPGAKIGDVSVRPLAAVVQGAKPSPEELAGIDLVIAGPDALLPGVTPGSRVVAEGAGWVPHIEEGGTFPWPPFVSLKDVHVKAVREAAFSPEWQVLARVEGRPWIAVRKEKGLWIWLASWPAAESDWSKSGAGFVAFFAEMQARAFGTAGMPPWVEWNRLPSPEPGAARVMALEQVTGGLAMALLLLAVGWQAARHSRAGAAA